MRIQNNGQPWGSMIANGMILAIIMFFVFWTLSFAGFGVHYPSGEPVERTFDPVVGGALSAATGLAVILIQSNQ